MPSANPVVRKPRWYFVPVRVLLVTVIVTLLSFAVSLFLGILGIIIGSWLRGGAPNMAMAYRHIAAPVAIAVGAIVLVSAIVIEVRHYRQAKALAGIEYASKQFLGQAPGASGRPLG
jgi:cyanate permease